MPYSLRIKDGTRSCTGDRSYSSSEDETDNKKGTENIVHSRIERFKGRILVGRPKIRWMDNRMDIRALKTVNWKRCARDRNKWMSVVEQAKTHTEL
jgi:hypothetical protein